MPPCDTIISRVAALKAGMYDSVASETTKTSKPRSLASLAVDLDADLRGDARHDQVRAAGGSQLHFERCGVEGALSRAYVL